MKLTILKFKKKTFKYDMYIQPYKYIHFYISMAKSTHSPSFGGQPHENKKPFNNLRLKAKAFKRPNVKSNFIYFSLPTIIHPTRENKICFFFFLNF